MTSGPPYARRSFLLCVLLFIFIYAGFGIFSPFIPPLLQERGVSPALIGLILAAGTAVKLIAAPLAGRLGDRFHALPLTFAVAACGSALASLLYIGSGTTALLFATVLTHSLFTGPVTPLADALALGAAARSPHRYAWTRGAGSAAFIVGVVLSGQIVSGSGIAGIFVATAALMVSAAVAALMLRGGAAAPSLQPLANKEAIIALLRLRPFCFAVAISGIILGSHALHDGFTMIRWREAGIEPGVAGALWAVAVGAEVAVFFLVGGPVLARIGARGACLVACGAAILRWSVMAMTAAPAMMLLVQPLHGLTFALLHLACMQLIAENVPSELLGTAQGLYATLGAGISSVLLTVVAGILFDSLGASAFWAMAGLSACAAPVILRLPARSR